MKNFRHILVPVDFEPPSLHALDVALDLARKFDARLTILHAWDIVAYEYAETVHLPGDFLGDLKLAAQLQLDDAVACARKLLPRTEGLLVRGNAALVVLETIKKIDADLVVVGTHGRGGVARICALIIDGIHVGDHLVVVALGIDEQGEKHVLGLHEGATENESTCRALIEDLVARGVRSDRSRLNSTTVDASEEAA